LDRWQNPQLQGLKLSFLLGNEELEARVELLPGFKFTGKMVKKIKFTGKIGKNGKKLVKLLTSRI
jgi:hypothetical protein